MMSQIPELRLEIDEHDLVNEWKGQPKQAHAWADRVADLSAIVDESKSMLLVVAAQLELEIRADPDLFGITKVTEGVIKAKIPTQKSHTRVTADYNKARHALKIAESALDALKDRKHALQDMVKLWIADYYADPKIMKGDDDTNYGKELGRRAARSRGVRRRGTESDE